jgi:hypothetical protein
MSATAALEQISCSWPRNSAQARGLFGGGCYRLLLFLAGSTTLPRHAKRRFVCYNFPSVPGITVTSAQSQSPVVTLVRPWNLVHSHPDAITISGLHFKVIDETPSAYASGSLLTYAALPFRHRKFHTSLSTYIHRAVSPQDYIMDFGNLCYCQVCNVCLSQLAFVRTHPAVADRVIADWGEDVHL